MRVFPLLTRRVSKKVQLLNLIVCGLSRRMGCELDLEA